jgi:glycolate oxidase
MSAGDEAWVKPLRRRLGARHVLTSPAELLAYESDALTLFRCRPAAVVLPAHAEEVAFTMELLHRHGVVCTPRGAGTGLSGGALVPEGGVVLATTRMQAIREVDVAERRVLVEPGVVNAALTRAVEAHGLRFAPDPASQSVCTLGGNVAENAGGPMCFLHGTTSNHVLAAEVVRADGTRERWGHLGAAADGPDLRGLLCGSEGSLAVVVGLWLRLVPLPERTVTMLAAYDAVATACDAVSALVAAGLRPVALEVMDQRAIAAVEDSVYRSGLPREAGAVLLVEVEGHERQVEAEAAAIETLLRERGPLDFERGEDPARRAALWKGRKGAGGAIGRLAPDSYVMDGVVPRSRLSEIMRFVEEVEEETGLPVANLFHAGDGNIHPHFAYDGRDPEQAAAVESAGARILERCLELGGSLSGEHGIGLEKQHLLDRQYDEATLAAMRRVAACFDPDDRLNPGRGLPLGRGCAEAFHRHRREPLDA